MRVPVQASKWSVREMWFKYYKGYYDVRKLELELELVSVSCFREIGTEKSGDFESINCLYETSSGMW